jgi:hypothetical protein
MEFQLRADISLLTMVRFLSDPNFSYQIMPKAKGMKAREMANDKEIKMVL